METDQNESQPKESLNEQAETEGQILARLITRANELWTYWQPNITESETDRNMAAGDQWPLDIALMRKGRVTLTVNKLPQFIERVLGSLRQNPTAIKYRAKTYNNGKKIRGKLANKEYSTAEIRGAIAKEIEEESNALVWYDRAATQMVTGALGYLRVDAVAGDNGKPKLEIGGVINPSLVLVDYAGLNPDFSDARDGFIFTPIPRKEYERRWPDKPVVDVSYPNGYQGLRWVLEQMIMTAEYWERDDNNRVTWRRISGAGILDGGTEGIETPFKQISIVPVFGREITLANGYRMFESAHRHARDAMRDSNYWRSAMTAMIALQPKQARVATTAQIQNNRTAWEGANVQDPALLVYDADPEQPTPPFKERPADVPVAVMQIYQTCMNDLRESIGMYSQSTGAVRGDESGRAILAKERQDDTGLYVFTQSRDRAIRRVGVLLQQGIKAMYVEEQMIRIIAEDETIDHVTINEPEVDEMGQPVPASQIDEDFDCYVETSVAYSTQRIEAVNAYMDMAKAMPETMGLGADIMAENMDVPGADRLASRLRRAMDPKFLSPNELEEIAKEQSQMPQEQPSPDAQIAAAIEAAKQAQKEAQVMIEQLKVQQKQIEAQAMQLSAGADQKIRLGVAEAIAEYIKETKGGAQPPPEGNM